jgi:hypothetical protein
MHDRALEIRKPNSVPRTSKLFFILVVHSPLRVVGHMVAPDLPSRGGRAQSHGTRGSVRAHLIREARFGVERHMAVLELTSARRRGPGSWDTWRHQSPPQQGGEVRGSGVRDSVRAHLRREARPGAEGYVAAPELNSSRRRGPGLQDMWQRWSPPR